MLPHKTGTLILFAEGEYSDYCTGPMIRALKDLDLGSVALDFYAQCPVHPYDDERRDADGSSFAKWLVEHGLAEEIEYEEVHVGSYGRFELDEMTRAAKERSETVN